MKRKIIQISTIPDTNEYYAELYALCDDGSVWHKTIRMTGEDGGWKLVEDIPQPND
jgi:hypothetical protein